MKRMWMILVLVVLSSPISLNAQETVTFKLGTFADEPSHTLDSCSMTAWW